MKLIKAITSLTRNCFRKPWLWLGDEKNHNASITLMTLAALVVAIVALPHFSHQINNIQVTVDSIEANLRGFYSHFDKETFHYTQVKDDFRSILGGTSLTLALKTMPIPNSINVWWGEMYLSPNDYSINGNILTIDFIPQTIQELADPTDQTPFVVTYVENGQ